VHPSIIPLFAVMPLGPRENCASEPLKQATATRCFISRAASQFWSKSMNAALEAYNRLMEAQRNRPSQEVLDALETERAEEALQGKKQRLRKGVA
jgi:hypothetical protein